MTTIISAAFGHNGNAKLAEAILREHGFRVRMNHQIPMYSRGSFPKLGDYSPAARNPMPSDRDSAILTVLVTEDTRRFAMDTILMHSGRPIG